MQTAITLNLGLGDLTQTGLLSPLLRSISVSHIHIHTHTYTHMQTHTHTHPTTQQRRTKIGVKEVSYHSRVITDI